MSENTGCLAFYSVLAGPVVLQAPLSAFIHSAIRTLQFDIVVRSYEMLADKSKRFRKPRSATIFLNGTASLFPAIEISIWQLPRLALDGHHPCFEGCFPPSERIHLRLQGTTQPIYLTLQSPETRRTDGGTACFFVVFFSCRSVVFRPHHCMPALQGAIGLLVLYIRAFDTATLNGPKAINTV